MWRRSQITGNVRGGWNFNVCTCTASVLCATSMFGMQLYAERLVSVHMLLLLAGIADGLCVLLVIPGMCSIHFLRCKPPTLLILHCSNLSGGVVGHGAGIAL